MTEVLYKQVVDQIKESEHEQVLSTLDKILKEQPNDEPTNIAKAIALIQNGQFDKALDHIKQKNLDAKLGFEKVYAMYRANKLNDALTAITSIKQDDNLLQLKAQILYKLEQFDKSSGAYEELIKKQKKVDEETLTNLTAALTLGEKFNEALAATKRADNNTFELEYNASCAAIGIKDLDQAEKHLKLAKDLCRETLEEENYTEEEILDESAGILTQLAFVKQLRGQSEEARNLYDTVIKAKPTDAVVLAVASNNSISLKGSESDLFDSVKKMKHTTSQKVQGKLTPAQQRGITLNSTLLLLLQKKYDECKEAVAGLSKQFPDSDIPPLILAAMHYKEKQFEEAVKTLQAYINKYPSEKTLRVQITLAQLHLNQGNFEEVIKILQATSVRYEPSVIATIISLYQKTNNIDACINVLDQSIQYWREKYEKGDKTVKDKLLLMLNKNAQYKISVNKYQEAAATYEMLVKVDPENKEHVAGLVNALSHFDIAKAETYTKQLPSIDIGDINAESLESETVLAFRSKKQSVDVLDINKESSSSQEKKKKKKRKNKPAKNFNAKKQPDPERWLPLKMRAAYQKKGAGMRSASQGSSVEGVQQKLQVKKGDNVKTSSPATPAAATSTGAAKLPQPPKSTGPKGARNKKKKR